MSELTSIATEIERQDLLHEVILQLNKDLVLSHIGFEFKEDASFEDFWLDLVAIVRDLLHKQYEKYLHFIYRIDLSERDLLVANIAPFDELEEFVAFQIVRRIYKKVYFRKNFTNSGGSF